VDRLLAKDPAERFQQPSELAEALATSTLGHDLAALAQTAQARRAKQGDGNAADYKETVPFHLGMKRPPAGKSTPTPTAPVSNRQALSYRRMTRAAFAVLVICLFAAAAIGWRLLWHDPADELPWPTDYPAALREMPWGKPTALVARKAWRPRDAVDPFRGRNNHFEQTYQPTWRRRLLGRGLYYEGSDSLELFAGTPPSLTFMELSHDLRERWFELDMELMSAEPQFWHGGLFFGWHEQAPGLAETYVLFLERGQRVHLLHLAAVTVRWQRTDAAEPIYPFVPIKQQKIVTLKTPAQETRFTRIGVRATPGRLTVSVEGSDKVTVATQLDPRGALGLWVQKGWTHCGDLLLTPLPGPWAD
jgi:hypothetical protein